MWQSPSGPNSRVRCVLYPTTASNNFHRNLCNSIKYPFILHVIKVWTKTSCCNWDILIESKMPFFLLLTIWNSCQMEQSKKNYKLESPKCTTCVICWFRVDGWGVDYDLEILNIFLPTIGLETPSGGGEYTHVSSGIPHSVDCKGSQRYSHISLFSW